ncbi:hypothetical protein FN846DRAFT_941506 [Sphaerosporella brunnea]|uniref:Uncharacterized protein n=1 Tax=Sphaerosporella brunnea TaxID=1250544 RepID=A0A5J5F1R6_9PEZI|nr:hypothetical protein FN846DRAFT_941506 [Sphaerosporella brunnea]
MAAPALLDVDLLIFDYLLWYCTNSLLTERRLRAEDSRGEIADVARNGDNAIKLLISFHRAFTRQHPHSLLPETLSLRLRICRFAVIFLRRIDVTSHDFVPDRNERRKRTLRWLRRRGISSVLGNDFFVSPATPFSQSLLRKNSEALRQRTSGSIFGGAALCDALWEFLLLTAHIAARDGEVTDAWMMNAVDFMIQAALEEYRCHGRTGADAMNECFAVGFTPLGDLADQTTQEIAVNDLFAAQDGAIGEEFEAQRNEGLLEMVVPPGASLEGHFESLAVQYPWKEFEDGIINCLVAAFQSQPRPVLAQLEQGRLEGFDTGDVHAVLAGAGVPVEEWQ